jgi:hypothetical protein
LLRKKTRRSWENESLMKAGIDAKEATAGFCAGVGES